jgi:hypothetical protein
MAPTQLVSSGNIEYQSSGRFFIRSGRFYLFYTVTTSFYYRYASTLEGLDSATPTLIQITGVSSHFNNQDSCVHYNSANDTVGIAYRRDDGLEDGIKFRYGTFNADGSITFGTNHFLDSTFSGYQWRGIDITAVASGKWVVSYSVGGTADVRRVRISSNSTPTSGGSWTSILSSASEDFDEPLMRVVSLASGDDFMYTYTAKTKSNSDWSYKWRTYESSVLGSENDFGIDADATAGNDKYIVSSLIRRSSGNLIFAVKDTDNDEVVTFEYNGATWSKTVVVSHATATKIECFELRGSMYVFFVEGTGDSIKMYREGSGSYSDVTTLLPSGIKDNTDFVSGKSSHSTFVDSSDDVYFVWSYATPIYAQVFSPVGAVVFGIRLTFPDATGISQDTSIGLYVSGGVAQFRWWQTDVTGWTGDTWKNSMIALRGLSPYKRSVIVRSRGAIASPSRHSVSILNTSNFWSTIDTAGLSLIGLKYELVEFNDTTEDVIWTGIVETAIRDRKIFKINAKTAYHKRVSVLGEEQNIEVGEENDSSDADKVMVPITFGYIDKALLNQTKNIINRKGTHEKTDSDFMGTGESYTVTDSIFFRDHFPIVDTATVATFAAPALKYSIKIANFAALGTSATALNLPELSDNNVYLKSIEGKSKDQSRYILTADMDLVTAGTTIIELELDDYYEEELKGNSSATATDQTWVVMEQVQMQYDIDEWPCEGFLDVDGNTPANPQVFIYDKNSKIELDLSGSAETVTKNIILDPNNRFIATPDDSFQDSGSDSNYLSVNARHFVRERDTINIDSFVLVPVRNVQVPEESDLSSAWSSIGPGWSKFADGMYTDESVGVSEGTAFPSNLDEIVSGRDFTTVDPEFFHDQNADGDALLAIEFQPPDELDELIQYFDSVYLGISMFANRGYALGLHMKRFIGDSSQEITIAGGNGSYTGGYRNLPGYYYTNNPTSHEWVKNLNFSSNQIDALEGSISYYRGYMNYEIPGLSDIEKAKSIEKFLFVVTQGNSSAVSLTYSLSNLAFIFRKRTPISKKVFTPFKGRIYNDTWDTRKTSTNMIDNPIDILEHACRLQNWSEVQTSIPTATWGNGWGKNYASSALVNTSTGVGGFDQTELNYWRDTVKIGRQIINVKNANTEAIKRSICENFFLVNYVDRDGKESVARLTKNLTAPDQIVTLADMFIPGAAQPQIIEPKPEDVYCEPFVNYRKNYGNNEYRSIIKIRNASADSFDASYVDGVSSSVGEALWNKCNTLWNKVRHVTPPPKSLTNLDWLDNVENESDVYAQWYLDTWLDFMSFEKIRFQVHYHHSSGSGSAKKTKHWTEGQHFIIQLPHETANSQVECVLTSINISLYDPHLITIEAIMLDATSPVSSFIQDTMTLQSEGADADWQDTMDTGNTQYQKIT